MNCSQLNTSHHPSVNMASTWCRRQHIDMLWTLERPWKVDAIQKSSLLKRFEDSKNLTVGDSISLFVDDPYNKMFTILSSKWFNKVLSRLQRLSRSFVQRVTQEIMTVSLSFGITKVEWINSILEIIAKFMFIQVTKWTVSACLNA